MRNKYISVGLIILLLITSFIVINKKGAQEPLVFREEQKIRNITAFAKIYGYVRYFHPSDEAADSDWETFGLYGVERVKNAKTKKELHETLEDLFSPIAPTVRITNNEVGYSYADIFEENNTSNYLFWQHLGVETNMTLIPSTGNVNPYASSNRVVFKSNLEFEIQLYEQVPPKEKWVIHKEVSNDLHLYLPLVIPINEEEKTIGTTSESFTAFEELKQKLKNLKQNGIHATDENARVSGIITTWNIFQHYYPYWDEVEVNWEAQLAPYLTEALHDQTYEDYLATLRKFVENIQDAGAVVTGKNDSRMFSLPIRVREVDEKIIVTETQDSQYQIGDVVHSIDGTPVMELLTNQKLEISGPEHYKKAIAELKLVRGPFGESTEIEVLRNGESLLITSSYEIENTVTLNQSVSIQEIEEGIFYVPLHGDINTIRMPYYVDLLQSAKGVIFDARYEEGGMAYLFMQHLFAEPIPSIDIRSPQNILPDQEGVEYMDLAWMIEPKEPTLQGEIVFLASNWGDPILRQIKDYQLGTIIGEQTAGQIGYLNRFLLFDGIYISFTAIKTKGLYGGPHHVHGVIPDILVEPTFEAIQEGKNLSIEKAVQFIKDNQ